MRKNAKPEQRKIIYHHNSFTSRQKCNDKHIPRVQSKYNLGNEISTNFRTLFSMKQEP